MSQDELTALHTHFWFLYDRDRYKEAFKIGMEYISNAPENEHGYALCSIAIKAQFDYEQALSYIDKALELDPVDVYNLTHKGKILYHMSRYQLSQEQFLIALQLEPENHELYAHLGEGELMIGNIEQARKYTLKSLEIEPAEIGFSTMARIDFFTNNYDDAKVWISKGLGLNPNNQYLIYLKGMIHVAQKQYLDGKTSILSALKLSPTNQTYQNAMTEAVKLEFLPYRVYKSIIRKNKLISTRFKVLGVPVFLSILIGLLSQKPGLIILLPLYYFGFLSVVIAIIEHVTILSLLKNPLEKFKVTKGQIFEGILLLVLFIVLLVLFIAHLVLHKYGVLLFVTFSFLIHLAAFFVRKPPEDPEASYSMILNIATVIGLISAYVRLSSWSLNPFFNLMTGVCIFFTCFFVIRYILNFLTDDD